MQHSSNETYPAAPKVPWNKGKIIGARPPLQTKHVWSIRTKLQMDGKKRDLAMFNLAIDSKLRGCDVVHIKVEDIAPHGLTADRACVRQRKTGHPVKFELTEQTGRRLTLTLRPSGSISATFCLRVGTGQTAASRPGNTLAWSRAG